MPFNVKKGHNLTSIFTSHLNIIFHLIFIHTCKYSTYTFTVEPPEEATGALQKLQKTHAIYMNVCRLLPVVALPQLCICERK